MRAAFVLLILAALSLPPPDNPLGFPPSQVWAYLARQGEERSRLVIEEVDREPGSETVVWIRLVGIRVRRKNAPPIVTISRISYEGSALARFVTHRLDGPLEEDGVAFGDRAIRWPTEGSESEPIASLLDYLESMLTQ